MRQGVFLDPTLQTISDFLDPHEEMIEKVRGDLERGLKTPAPVATHYERAPL